MAHAGSFPIPRRSRPLGLGEGAATLALGTLTASAMLLAPVVLWKRYGDGNLLRTIAVTLAALLLCWVVVRVITRRYAARRLPVRTHAHTVAGPPPCRTHDVVRSVTQRDRRDPSTRPCGLSRCRAGKTSRGPRDLGCRAGARPPARRRNARRRTRP
jgi:hypothetical protein